MTTSGHAGFDRTTDALDQDELLRMLPKAALHERMGIEILELSRDRVVGRMPVAGNTQPYGLLHGGASCVLAEGLGSYAAVINAGPGFLALGIEINATHHRAAGAGFVTGVATPLHVGRSVSSFQIVVTDERERRVCTARLTCLIRPATQEA